MADQTATAALPAAPAPAPAPSLPSADDFFGDAGKQPPTADQFFGPAPGPLAVTARAAESLLGIGPAKSSVAMEEFLNHTAVGRVLDAFGQGARQGWGSEPLGLSPEAEKWLRGAGIFNDYAKGENNLIKNFNEALIRPAATALTGLYSTAKGLVTGSGGAVGALFGGASEAAAQTGQEVGAPILGRDLAALPQALMPEIGEGVGMVRARTPATIAEARSLGVIGEGEEGYFGTAPETPEAEAARAEATREHLDNVKEEVAQSEPEGSQAAAPAEPGAPEAEAAPTAAEAAPPDVHTVARQIAPEVFQRYDDLSTLKDTYRRWIDDLAQRRDEDLAANPPHAAELDALDQQEQEILGKVGGVEDRLTKRAASRLDEIRQQRAAFQEDTQQIGASDTPDMRFIRQKLMDADFKQRDLAPQVSDAYRQAQEQIGVPAEAPTAPAPAPEAAAPQAEAPQPVPEEQPKAPEAIPSEITAGTAPKEAPAAPEAKAVPAEAAQTEAKNPVAETGAPAGLIAEDVERQLSSAGRPPEEARAAAALVQAHYEARAARFQGQKGTAEDLYRAEGPAIRGAERKAPQRALEMAQPEAPKELEQGARGKVAFGNARTTITLFRDADASTFLHETGHMWLEELMADARDPDAPADLVKDAQTVRDWIGAKDDEPIARRMHERFARGFERYMMEGRAPTQALARVFAQFRQWLIQIYRTVNRLRAPITDDIRDVFDRLIATPQERGTVIAPERPEESLAAQHERLAEETPPEHANEVADRIAAEAAAEARKEVPEVHAEFGGPEGEAGEGAPVGARPDGGGDEGQPVPGPAGGGEPVGEVGASGGEAAPVGGGARRGAERTEQPAGPNDVIPEPKSDLVDKAGNIRLDLLNTPEDINEVLRQTAEENGEFMGARRGVVSDQQVLDLADAMGIKAKEINLAKLRRMSLEDQIPLAARVVALRKMLIQSATATWDAMRAVRDSGTEGDVLAYAEARQRHTMIQETLSSVTAEQGRALRAFRKLEGMGDADALKEFMQSATGRTPEELRQEALRGAALDTPSAVSKYLHDADKPDFWDMMLEYWVNGLISGPATHTTYSVGNALLALWKAVPETGTAALVGALRGGEDRVLMGEVGAGLHGVLTGSREGIIAAGKALRSGTTTLLPGEGEALSPQRLSAIVQPRKAIPGTLGEVARLPSRGIATIHSFFRMVGYEQSLHQLAYREAAKEGLGEAAFSQRVADLTSNPTSEMMEEARAQATNQTLMGRGSEFTQTLSRLTNTRLVGVPLLKFIAPFVHIGSNIMDQALLERTPFGILEPEIRANLLGRNGRIAQDTQIARMMVGTALGVATIGLAAEGLVNGSGPSDPKQAAMYRAVKGPPNSVRIGDTWYDLHRLGPLGMLFSTAANMYELGDAVTHEQASQIASQLTFSVTKSLLDESWMRGPAEFIQAVTDPTRYGARYVQTQIASFMPFSVGMSQIARQIDPNLREARTILDTIRSKTPFISEDLLPRRDIWGEPMAAFQSIPGTAIYAEKAKNDPVERAMAQVGFWPALPQRKIRGVTLSDQQYDDFSRTAGRLARMRLEQIVGNPGFALAPPQVQTEIFKRTFTGAREQARSLIMMQNPAIIEQAMQAKLHPLQKAVAP